MKATQTVILSWGPDDQHLVRVQREFPDAPTESRAYYSSTDLATAKSVASLLRRDIRHHGMDVITFTDYPVVVRQTRAGLTYWGTK